MDLRSIARLLGGRVCGPNRSFCPGPGRTRPGCSEVTRYPQDRASVLATTLISIVVRHLRTPELHAEIAQTLREEFHDIARQARDETRPSGE
jgi:hypothetical protein